MKISELHIYPIKSLGGIALTESQAGISGLKYDRQWMLVDRNGKFLSQRSLPQMALFQVALKNDALHIVHKKHLDKGIQIPVSADVGELKKVSIWDDELPALAIDPLADEWFSDLLHFPCSLVKMSPLHKRWLKKKYQINREYVGFADSMPFLLIGQSSLDDLNARLETPVPMSRFRPNMVFSGGSPYIEDTWDRFSVGTVPFKITKPCARCIMTTVDLASGEKGKEPLSTLAQYRKQGKKILFGQNGIVLEESRIAVGDVLQPK
ncbi:MOSC domain-containing protein [Cyclobacterium jeungdonense]|uniref:MOSC domain-containing protein n=1 Tax=Cyclobacterium jeungdonense TaxID=708087 RepID=A0ABT8C2W1_9BACT|nr:MOSC N-terminal beta barrel domain-containing protein [Cyclobacterium jeungdonense]MDN3686840.1 MOSC domain-containing protein [Cyclobacterium jeungdonense]